ncbi:hypothetical protein FB566_0558 [Stackebrandtia endophytica]|uniref:Uncharacterized protein n=1 Tax=Stackebrandtia endophytica TaxID=1496996 RepID=A0A543ARA6_9ACTN|nr:hypothetical protein [Stackebrandtia endophytica]TQL75066.1 hypothetical protein FB566_0558 [Stackebrandtia endophytica]
MNEPGVRRPVQQARLFATGIVLSAVSVFLILVFAPPRTQLLPAFLFLGFCLPLTWRGVRAVLRERPDVWQRNGILAMARIGSLRQSGSDEVGAPYYVGTAVVEPTGQTVTLRSFQYPDRFRQQIEAMDRWPVQYLPTGDQAKVRLDLIELVLERSDPRPIT